MTATPYADIRRRLAEATGPDTMLDAAIAKCLGIGRGSEPFNDNDGWDVVGRDVVGRWQFARPFTASLDAALELAREKLPSGWIGCELIEFERGRAQAGLGFASLGNGATLPLAVLDALFAEAEEAADD